MKPLSPLLLWLFTIALLPRACEGADPEKPNVVIILMDDMGYADVGCFGAQG